MEDFMRCCIDFYIQKNPLGGAILVSFSLSTGFDFYIFACSIMEGFQTNDWFGFCSIYEFTFWEHLL
jgi:hypothetical protein